jgi:MGT family glycosyltransferase
MARFLFGSLPLTGHVTPGLPLARALVARGHQVRWYTGRKFRDRIEATGARWEPLRAAPDYDDEDLEAAFPGISRRTGLAALKFGAKHLFLDPAPAQMADLQGILEGFPADVVIGDPTFTGALFLAERGGPPRAVYGISALTLPSRDTAPFGLGLPPATTAVGRLRNRALGSLFDRFLFRDVDDHYNAIRARVGLPPSGTGALADALRARIYLQGTVAGFEYPRSDLPEQVHFVGAFLPDPSPDFAPPPWWCELLQHRVPVVHVTQGTMATSPEQLLIPTMQALAREAVLVVATTGRRQGGAALTEAPPANARVEGFIPYGHLMPHVDVMVTNGGYGGVQIALAHGVPLVAAGRTEEKLEVCARVAWCGAGIDLKTSRPSPAGIRNAVRDVLSDPRYGANARRLAAQFARLDAAAEATSLLEALAAGEQTATAAVALRR